MICTELLWGEKITCPKHITIFYPLAFSVVVWRQGFFAQCAALWRSDWQVGKVNKPFPSALAGVGLNPTAVQPEWAPLCPLLAGRSPASASDPSDGGLALDYTLWYTVTSAWSELPSWRYTRRDASCSYRDPETRESDIPMLVSFFFF